MGPHQLHTEVNVYTVDNVAKIETMLRIDSRYAPSDDYSNEKYLPYWMRELGKHLGRFGGEPEKDLDTVITNVVAIIDRENSTHLNADNVGRGVMEERIKKLVNNNELLYYLKEPKREKFDLIGILSEKTKEGKGGRCNISFASKFCHYACFYIFEGEDAQDNFSIYDSVVVEILPRYLKYYEIEVDEKKIRNKDYTEYCKAIDGVIRASGNRISRYGFDHLLWYYFKDKVK